MKKWIVTVLAIGILSLGACGSDDSQRTVEFDLHGMTCVSCEQSVRQIMEGLGATVLSVSARENTLSVEFDADQISQQEIEAALVEGGYEIR